MPAHGHALTLGAVVEKYLAHCEAEEVHGAAAREDRVRTLGLFVARHGDLDIAEAKPYHLSDFIADQKGWKSSATRRSKASAVKAAFEWAKKGGRIDRNPFSMVQYQDSERRDDMPDKDFAKLCAVANKPFERILRFLRMTGCRVGEACRATWDQFDLDRGLWVIDKHKTRKTTKKPRVVALAQPVIDLLRGLRQEPTAFAPVVGAEQASVDVPTLRMSTHAKRVFVNNRGTPWNRWTLAQTLKRLKKKHRLAGNWSMVGTRHRWGTAAAAAGASAKVASAQMGHASVKTYERYYCDLSEEIDALKHAANLALPRDETPQKKTG